MKKIFLFTIGLAGTLSVLAQTQTVVFKPGPKSGQDAYLKNYLVPCTEYGETVETSNDPRGYSIFLSCIAWTYNGQGCGEARSRAIIKFVELNQLPNDINILSAELKLHTPPYEPNVSYTGWPGNVPDNNLTLYRISPGQNHLWDDQTVTWNSFYAQPNPIIPATAVSIPSNSIKYNTTANINVTNIVQNILNELPTDPYANNGFLLKLNTEQAYRSYDWASCEYPNPDLWPELKIVYEQKSTNINNIKNNLTDFSITPNPTEANWYLNFSLSQQSDLKINLYDVTGRLVNNMDLSNLQSGKQKIQINGNDFCSGVYLIELLGPDIYKKEKLIKF